MSSERCDEGSSIIMIVQDGEKKLSSSKQPPLVVHDPNTKTNTRNDEQLLTNNENEEKSDNQMLNRLKAKEDSTASPSLANKSEKRKHHVLESTEEEKHLTERRELPKTVESPNSSRKNDGEDGDEVNGDVNSTGRKNGRYEAGKGNTQNLPPGVATTRNGKWRVQTQFQGRQRYIGTFDSIKKAGLANEIARETFGRLETGTTAISEQEIEAAIHAAKKAALEGVNHFEAVGTTSAMDAGGEEENVDITSSTRISRRGHRETSFVKRPVENSNSKASSSLKIDTTTRTTNHVLSRRDVIMMSQQGDDDDTIIADFGRGKGFCRLIQLYRPKCVKAKRKNAEREIAIEICQTIKDNGGSFVKLLKHPTTIIPPIGQPCILLADHLAIDTTRRILRGTSIVVPKPILVTRTSGEGTRCEEEPRAHHGDTEPAADQTN